MKVGEFYPLFMHNDLTDEANRILSDRRAKRAARAAQDKRIADAQAATRRIVALGACPDCGRGLRQNLSITGWWQCEQLGATTHRKYPTLPPCTWQGFTE